MGLSLNLKLNLKKEELLKNKVLLIGIGVALLSVWYGYSRIYKPTTNSLRHLNMEFSKEGMNAKISKRVAALEGELSGYKRYFAKEGEQSWLLDKVSQAANKAGLKIISLNSKPLVYLSPFIYGSVALTLSGTFHQLGDFVADIEGSKEFIRIEKLSFKKDKEFLNADITVSTYFWK